MSALATAGSDGAQPALPLLGETICAFLLVVLIFASEGRRAAQPFAPLVNPPC